MKVLILAKPDGFENRRNHRDSVENPGDHLHGKCKVWRAAWIAAFLVSLSFGGSPATAADKSREFTNATCSDVASGLSSDDKKEKLKKNDSLLSFQGKWVKWTATVMGVGETLWGVEVSVACLRESKGTADATLTFEIASKESLLHLSRGQQIQFSGQIAGYSELGGISIQNAELTAKPDNKKAFSQGPGEVKMVLATGGTAGTYYPFGGAMAKIWNSKIPGMNVTAQTTGASGENVRLVNKKEAELALVQSDTLDFAFSAKEAFKEKLTSMMAVAVLYPEVIQVVVRADSPAKDFAGLKGMKVGVGAPGSGAEANFRQLCDAYGISKDDVKAQFLSFSESAEAFKDKHIDAFIVTAGIPNAAIMDISTQNEIRILNVTGEPLKKLEQKYPFLSAAKIPANTYKGLAAETNTVAVNAVLIMNSVIKEYVVYNLTKALFENQAELASAHAKGKELNIQAAVKGVSIPFHPGAVKYYKEKGLMK